MPDTPSQDSKQSEFVLLGRVAGAFSAQLLQNIALVVWSSAATLEGLAVYEQLCADCRKRFPERMSVIHVIAQHQLSLPNAAAREKLACINREYVDLAGAVAVVIFGEGFFAGALRGLVTSLFMAVGANAGVQTKIVGSIEASAEWLPPVHMKATGVNVASDVLLAALRQAMSRH